MITIVRILVMGVAVLLATRSANAEPKMRQRILERTPDEIIARRIAKRNEILDALKSTTALTAVHPFMVVIEKRQWKVGKTVTVAFNGGSNQLHDKIMKTAATWSKYANIKFESGRDPATGQHRTWSIADQDYAADIRISFHHKEGGYWSQLGTESRDPSITKPSEASMNLQGFDKGTPSEWEGIVLHEFGHALGLEHEHQHPTEGCDDQWRWKDDPGYVDTVDEYKRFKDDDQGRLPGLYKALGGPPNNWPESTVDYNLKQLENSSAYKSGNFDKNSIMKYAFDEWMFTKGNKSRCYSDSNDVLSSEDRTRIAEYYPKKPSVARFQNANDLAVLNGLRSQVLTSPVLTKQLDFKTMQLN